MSIADQVKMRELERRIADLEKKLDELSRPKDPPQREKLSITKKN